MAIFYRHDIIYQAQTTGWWEIAAEEPVDESGWLQADNPTLVPARKVPPSSLSFVDDVAVIDSGWEQAFNPPLVPARKTPPSSTIIVQEVAVVLVEDPGWEQAFSPPLVLIRKVPPGTSTPVVQEFPVGGGFAQSPNLVTFDHPIIYQGMTTGWYEIPVIESGWDQAFNPPLVPLRKVPPSTSVNAEEIPVIETGWAQTFNPPLVPLRVVAPSSISFVDDVAPPVVEDPGWEQAYNPPLVPARVIPPSSLVFTDEVAIIESGWVQIYNPPLVPDRVIPPSSTIIVLDVADIDTGWIQDANPMPAFLLEPRFLPESSTVVDVDAGPAPAVVTVRMRLLGGGLLKRKQLG